MGSEPQVVNTQGGENGMAILPVPDCSHTACPTPCPAHGRHCPKIVHRHVAGQPCPLTHGLGQRLGRGDGRPAICPIFSSQPIPAIPPQGGFFGTLATPRQYQYNQAPMGYPMPMQAGQPAGSSQDYPGYVMPPANERIVYIPYAMPPPITVERLAKALPIPKITLRRVLGDAYMYEYPEMPMHLYTTRGPRDFLAPTPPGIGE